MIAALLTGIAANPGMRAARGYDAIALAMLLFLLSLRRSGERAGRIAERSETMEKTNDVQRRMLEAAARRPRDRDELADRLRDGGQVTTSKCLSSNSAGPDNGSPSTAASCILNVKDRRSIVNRAFYLDALAMAERHIVQGKRIILNQRRIIAELDDRGADSTIASKLLETFLISQQLHEDDRRRFEIEIAKFGNEGCQ